MASSLLVLRRSQPWLQTSSLWNGERAIHVPAPQSGALCCDSPRKLLPVMKFVLMNLEHSHFYLFYILVGRLVFQMFFVLLIFLVRFVLMDSQIRVRLVTPCGLEGDADGEGSLVHSRGGGPVGGWFHVAGEWASERCWVCWLLNTERMREPQPTSPAVLVTFSAPPRNVPDGSDIDQEPCGDPARAPPSNQREGGNRLPSAWWSFPIIAGQCYFNNKNFMGITCRRHCTTCILNKITDLCLVKLIAENASVLFKAPLAHST